MSRPLDCDPARGGEGQGEQAPGKAVEQGAHSVQAHVARHLRHGGGREDGQARQGEATAGQEQAVRGEQRAESL
jgi:hypothetical protein